MHSNVSLVRTLDIGAGRGGCQGGGCGSADGLGGRLRLRGGVCAALHLQSPAHCYVLVLSAQPCRNGRCILCLLDEVLLLSTVLSVSVIKAVDGYSMHLAAMS